MPSGPAVLAAQLLKSHNIMELAVEPGHHCLPLSLFKHIVPMTVFNRSMWSLDEEAGKEAGKFSALLLSRHSSELTSRFTASGALAKSTNSNGPVVPSGPGPALSALGVLPCPISEKFKKWLEMAEKDYQGRPNIPYFTYDEVNEEIKDREEKP